MKIILVAINILVGVSWVQGGEWYQRERIRVTDPFQLGMYHSVTSEKALRLMGTLRLGGKPARGRMYVILPKAEFEKIEEAGEREFVHHEKILDDNSARVWQDYFRKRAFRTSRVPVVFSIVGLTSKKAGAAVVLLDFLLAQDDARKIEAAELSALMETGGKFVEFLTIHREAETGNPYLHSDVFYQVRVEEKQRHYLIYSSVYAVKIEE